VRARDARITREQETLELLSSGAPGDILRDTLAARGWDLRSWQPGSLHHRPGAGVTGVFPIEVAPPAAPGHRGRPRPTSAPGYACITSCTLREPGEEVRVFHRRDADTLFAWIHPADPLLPGLPLALDVGRATMLAFGSSQDPRDTVLDLRSYRPLRRAVVHVQNGEDHRYLKALRRNAAAPLAERHRLLQEAGVPAPVLDGEPVQDVIAMRPATGRPLAELLMSDGAAEVEPHALVRVLTSLPAAVMSLPVRAPWSARVLDYAEGAVAALPSQADRIRRVAAGIDDAVRSTAAGPLVPTHGDFYEGNLLIRDGLVSGLLDVDALGPGRLVDDLACFLGHLAVLPGLHEGYTQVPEALLRFTDAFERHVDPAALRSRAAAVSLTLIAGARRRAAPRTGESGGTEAGTEAGTGLGTASRTHAAPDEGLGEAGSRLAVAERFLSEAAALGALPRGGAS
jgi:aminoglycoside phosphotransferase